MPGSTDEPVDLTTRRRAAPSGPLPIGFVVVAVVTVVELVRQGAFYPADAFTVGVVSLGLIVASLVVGVDRRGVGVTVAIGACVAWWMVAAQRQGDPRAFLPLGASMLGFLASFLVVRRLARLADGVAVNVSSRAMSIRSIPASFRSPSARRVNRV